MGAASVITSVSPSFRAYERNPYYWQVDSEGNQLPYVDRWEEEVIQNIEMYQSKVVTGAYDHAGMSRDAIMKSMCLAACRRADDPARCRLVGACPGNHMTDPILNLRGAVNLRDFGGYEAADARRVRRRRLFRSGTLTHLSADAQRTIRTDAAIEAELASVKDHIARAIGLDAAESETLRLRLLE